MTIHLLGGEKPKKVPDAPEEKEEKDVEEKKKPKVNVQ